MSNKKRSVLAAIIFTISTMLISACTQSLSTPPVTTSTVISTNSFVSPFPSAENPMEQIEEFAKQTQTAAASGGTPGTPQPITTSGTPATPTSAPTLGTPGTPTNVAVITSVATTSSGPAATSVPPGVRPSSYTLQNGEFPYCIARRFNVDPDQLLSVNGLTDPDVYDPGLTLTIPQSGSFPGSRMLATHPTNYTVATGDETLYSVACKYGDLDPSAIASANGLSVSAKLTAGQVLKIP